MTDDPHDAPRTAAGLAARVASGLLVDALLNGAILLSLVTGVAGLVTGGPVRIAAGLVVGIGGMAAAWYAMAKRWRDRRALLVGAGVTVIAIATFALIVLSA